MSAPPSEAGAGLGTRRALIAGCALALLAVLLCLFFQSHQGLGTGLFGGDFGRQPHGRGAGDRPGLDGTRATDAASQGGAGQGLDTTSQAQTGMARSTIPPADSPSTKTARVGAVQTPSVDPQPDLSNDATNRIQSSLLLVDSEGSSVGTNTAATSPGFFGARGKGTKFVYVVDRSTSMMSRGRFDAARTELIKSLRSLQPGMSFYVIFYDTAYEAMNVNTLQPASRVEDYIPWIERQRPQGATDPRKAMEIALKLSPHSIWLLSDGEFRDSVLEEIRRNNPARKTVINTIALHDGSGERLLQRIAQENNGEYRYIPSPTASNSPTRSSNWTTSRGIPQRQP